jgi:hypothetical protein
MASATAATTATAALAAGALLAFPTLTSASDSTLAAYSTPAVQPHPVLANSTILPEPKKPAPKPQPAPQPASRSLQRAPLAAVPTQQAATVTVSGDPKSIAMAKLAQRGWSGQFSCLDSLWNRESGWSTTAANPSGAYGIPQALPGSKMASAGPDWQYNAATQIEWGLNSY